jgi:predicted glutamine amidotransferase
MFAFEDFWQTLNKIQTEIKTPMLVHFRIRSAGHVDEQNCHPFYIDEKHALSHNGTLHDFNNPKSPVSDTILFTHNILKPLFDEYPNFYKTKFGRYLIEETIGSYNKITILNNLGEIVIFNESAGEWSGEVWYSNKSYLPVVVKTKKSHKDFRYNGRGKKQKASKYRSLEDILDEQQDILIIKGEILTAQQINKLTHYYRKEWGHKCKLKHLVRKEIVEPVFDEEKKT